MSRITNSIRNMASGILGHALTLCLQFVYRTVFIYTLGVTYLSVNGLFSNILTIFSVAELGIGQAVVFSLYRPIRENEIEKIQALMQLYKKTYYYIGMIVFAMGIVFYPILPYLLKGSADNIDHLSLIYFIFVFESGISYFFSYRQSFLSACQKQYVLNLWGCLCSVAREIIQIILLLTLKAYLPVLIFGAIWGVIQNIFYSNLVGRMFPYLRSRNKTKLDVAEKNNIFKNVKALIIYKIGTLALNSTDNIIISSVVGLHWVGLFSNYQVIVSSVNAFITVLFSSLTASIGHLNAGDDVEHKISIFKTTNLASFWINSIASICFMIALTPTVRIWIGDEWTLDFWTVYVISLNIYVAGMLYAPFNYRQTMGLFVYGKWRPIVSAIINIVVSIILGSRMGLKGVLLGTIIARITTNAWFDPYIVYKKGFNKSPVTYYLQYALYFVVYLIAMLVGLLIARIKLIGGLGDILIHCVVCGFGISVIYIFLFGKTKEFEYFKQVFSFTVAKIKEGRKNARYD